MKLTVQQQVIISSNDSGLAIIANPGTAKTTTLVKSAVHLMDKFSSEQFLISSFSRRDTHDLREKVKKELNDKPIPPEMVVTNHSFCNKAIVTAAHNFGIEEAQRYLESEKSHKLRICQGMLRSNFISEAINKVTSGQSDDIDLSILSQEIELWKSKCIPPEMIEDERRRQIFHEYELTKRSKRYLDFSDMLLLTDKLFSTNNQLLTHYQNRTKVILLDEMQDANPAWLNVLKHLVPTAEIVRVTGDMDQAIYSFRGSVSDFFNPLHKMRQFKKASLTTNFRSRDEIISHANKFMDVSMTGVIGTGGTVQYLGHFDNPEQEALVTTDAILELLNEYNPSDIMVLCRVGYGLRPISVALENAGVPFKLVGTKPFFRQPDIMDLMSYVKCAMPDTLTRRPWTFNPFMRIYNKPRRGLGKQWETLFWKHSGTIWERLQKYYPDNFVPGVRNLRDTLSKVMEMDNPLNIIHYIWTFGGYSDYHEKHVDKTIDDVEQLRILCHQFTDIPQLLTYEHSSLKKADSDDAVKLMTIHGSKGTEAKVVFNLHCNNQDVLPHKRGLYDEERRLFFVCSTRAIDKLYFSSCHWDAQDERTVKSEFINL